MILKIMEDFMARWPALFEVSEIRLISCWDFHLGFAVDKRKVLVTLANC